MRGTSCVGKSLSRNIMMSRRTCLLAGAGAAAALALSSAVVGVEAFAPQPNVRSVTKLNNDIAPTGELFLWSFVVMLSVVQDGGRNDKTCADWRIERDTRRQSMDTLDFRSPIGDIQNFGYLRLWEV